jgi:hypothetical protein
MRDRKRGDMLLRDMPTLETIRTAAIAIAAFIGLTICSGLITANVRQLANEKGWDAIFLRAWNVAPAWGRKMLSGWLPLRQLWWLWLSFGMSGGLGVALWLLAPVPMPISLAQQAQRETQSTAPINPAEPNPLRPEVVKWQAVSRLVHVSKMENLKCKVMLVRSPLPYAEDYATDLKLILDTARWDYEVTIAVGELEKGLSARAPFEPGIKRRCAEAFQRAIMNSGEGWSTFLSWQDASRPLDPSVKDCPECFQVGLGNPDR